jgi:hypothetical protein
MIYSGQQQFSYTTVKRFCKTDPQMIYKSDILRQNLFFFFLFYESKLFFDEIKRSSPEYLCYKSFYGRNSQFFCINLERLSLLNIFRVILCLWVRLGANPRVEHLKGASLG